METVKNAAETLPNPPAVRDRHDAVSDDGRNGRGAGAVAVMPRTAISGLVPQTLDDVYRLATAIAKSGLAPQAMKTPEQITVAILTGLELGLKPMFALNKIAVVNGRPTLWGDGIPALLWSRGFDIREWFDGEDIAMCEVTRPNGVKVVRSFTVDDAKAAGLWGKQGPWKQYPKRMLAMRARAFAARDGAADVLGGLYVAEEVIEGGSLSSEGNSEPFKRKSSAAAKRDGTDAKFNELRGLIANCSDPSELLMLRENNRDADGNPWEGMPMRWNEMLEDDFRLRASDIGLDLEGVE